MFVLAVVNFGTASTTASKLAAFGDVSRLTQSLYRGATWAKLNQSMYSKIANQFAKQFGVRLTKRGLGRFVPVAGIVAGASLNWLTLEQLADSADQAYRRRFLLDKYPQLSNFEAAPIHDTGEATLPGADEVISLLDIIEENGVNGDDPPTND